MSQSWFETVTGTKTAKRKYAQEDGTGLYDPSKPVRVDWALSQEIWSPGIWNLEYSSKNSESH